jgi:hypothetical protein
MMPSFPTGLTFAGIARLTNDNNLTNITVSGITFDAAAGAFVLDGNGHHAGNGSIGFNGWQSGHARHPDRQSQHGLEFQRNH